MTVKPLVALLLAVTASACTPFASLPEGTDSTAHYMEIPADIDTSMLMGHGTIGAGGVLAGSHP